MEEGLSVRKGLGTGIYGSVMLMDICSVSGW